MSLAIEINKLYKQYPDTEVPALDHLNLSVKTNSITGLLGPNGAGKSTAINILCGLIKSDSGKASILGHSTSTDVTTIRKIIGVVPQQIALFPNLSAQENFDYIGALYGISKTDIRNKSERLLQRLGLEKHANKRVGRYSGGMKRRANIIASLLHNPEILILDEPTAGVDVQSRAMILDFLNEYREQNKTVLYTSHLLEEAEKICDNVAIIDGGKFIVSGTPRELIKTTENCKNLQDVFLHHTGHSVRD